MYVSVALTDFSRVVSLGQSSATFSQHVLIITMLINYYLISVKNIFNALKSITRK